MNTQKFTFSDQPMEDGTIPELWLTKDARLRTTIITDNFETARWNSSIDSPLVVEELVLSLGGQTLTDAQTSEILEAMANLMVAVSRVGYEMAQAKHEGGEG
jgi:hypothetical protein